MDRFYKNVEKLYDFTYASKYGPDWIYSIFILFITFIIVTYVNFLNTRDELAANWNEVRCQPQNMALAGFINAPKDGSTSSSEYAKQNFEGCLNDMSNKSSYEITNPMVASLNYLAEIWSSFSESLNNIREYLARFRDNFANFIEEIMGQIMYMMIEFQKVFVSLRDLLNKILGIMTSALMGTLGLYYTLVSAFKAIFSLIKWIALAAIALAITSMFSIIGIPIGIILIVFVGVLIYMMVMMARGFPPVLGGLRFPRIPSPRFPRVCFDKDTKLVMNNKSIKKISEIKLNDKLKGNNTVYGVFKMLAENEKNNMYKLNKVVVSGNHKVKYLGDWVNVKDCPKSVKLSKYDDKIIYNLLTFSKMINIENNDFLDYDDITPKNLDKLNNSSVINKGSLHDNFGLFRKFIGGFYGDTKIKLQDNIVKYIKNINVGDVLTDNVKVVGVVELDCSDVKIKMVNTVTLMCSDNILHDSLGKVKTIQSVRGTNLGKVNCNKVYHLITDKNYFYIDFLKIYDYDYLIDHYLE